jgi:hypothetical protein
VSRQSEAVEIFIKISPADIAYFNFTIDAYEGLSSVRTMDGKKGLIKILIPVAFVDDVKKLLQAIKEEIEFLEIIEADNVTESKAGLLGLK